MVVRNTWWRCHKAPLSSSLQDVFTLWSYLYPVFWGTAFVSSVFLFHVAKLAVTGHPFLRKIHHWCHGMVVQMTWCVVEGCLKSSQCPYILDSSQTFGTVFPFFYPEYHSYGPVWYKDESTSCLVCRIQTTHGMGGRNSRIWIYFIYQLQWLRWADHCQVHTLGYSAIVPFQVSKYLLKMSLL